MRYIRRTQWKNRCGVWKQNLNMVFFFGDFVFHVLFHISHFTVDSAMTRFTEARFPIKRRSALFSCMQLEWDKMTVYEIRALWNVCHYWIGIPLPPFGSIVFQLLLTQNSQVLCMQKYIITIYSCVYIYKYIHITYRHSFI